MRTIAVVSPTYDTFKRWAKREDITPVQKTSSPDTYKDRQGNIYVPLYISGREAEIEKISGRELSEVIDLVPKRMSNWFAAKDTKTYHGLLGIAEMRIKTFS